MKSVHINPDEMFEVYQDGDRYYISVVVGGIAMYEVQREMNDEMIARFLKDPKLLIWCVEKIRREEV